MAPKINRGHKPAKRLYKKDLQAIYDKMKPDDKFGYEGDNHEEEFLTKDALGMMLADLNDNDYLEELPQDTYNRENAEIKAQQEAQAAQQAQPAQQQAAPAAGAPQQNEAAGSGSDQSQSESGSDEESEEEDALIEEDQNFQEAIGALTKAAGGDVDKLNTRAGKQFIEKLTGRKITDQEWDDQLGFNKALEDAEKGIPIDPKYQPKVKEQLEQNEKLISKMDANKKAAYLKEHPAYDKYLRGLTLAAGAAFTAGPLYPAIKAAIGLGTAATLAGTVATAANATGTAATGAAKGGNWFTEQMNRLPQNVQDIFKTTAKTLGVAAGVKAIWNFLPDGFKEKFKEIAVGKDFENFTPEQQSLVSKLGKLGIAGLENNQYNPEQIEGAALKHYNERIVPSIAERYGNSGGSGSFAHELKLSGLDLEEKLAGLKYQYGQNQQEHFGKLTQLGLTPKFPNATIKADNEGGLWGSISRGLEASAPHIASAYLAKPKVTEQKG